VIMINRRLGICLELPQLDKMYFEIL
jgi:hypothetical protein